MHSFFRTLISVCSLMAACGLAGARTGEDEFVESTLAKLSLQDKIGQLQQREGNKKDLGPLIEDIRRGRVSSVMNVVGPALKDSLQRIAVEQSPAGIPVIFARDVIHGFSTIMPIPLGQAAAWNPSVVYEGARAAAVEASEDGIRWGFAPMVDVSRDSRWGRIAESFGEDPLLNAVMGAQQVRGYQGDSLNDPTGIAACMKHFVGYGAAIGGMDYNGSSITERELRDIYLKPFKALADCGCASLMTSFQDNDGIQTSANGYLLKDVVRGEWGWDGVVVSDYNSIRQLVKHGMAEDSKDAARIGLNCGTDMDMESGVYVDCLEELVREGKVSIGDIDNCVRNVLRMKYRLGLFEHPYSQTETRLTGCPEHLGAALKAAEESAVLLKNDGALPVATGSVVLLTGPMADAAYDQMGCWNKDGDLSIAVTPKKAFAESGDFNLIHVPGLEYSRDRDRSHWKEVKRAARKADVILVCLGEEQILSGEAHSFADISLKGAQTDYVRFLAGLGKPLIATVMAGRATTIGEEVSLCNAVLYQFHPGTMGGKALEEIVSGRVTPSGKLPVTFPKMVGQSPIYYNVGRNGRDGANRHPFDDFYDIPRNAVASVVGHDTRYLDAGTGPLFPFGYGLSYTSFEFGTPDVQSVELSRSDTLKFSLAVTNTGAFDGAEVVQVYVSDPVASIVRPKKELKAFRKVFLQKGETQTLDFAVPVSEFGFHNQRGEFILESGRIDVTVSDCSDPERSSACRTFEVRVK